VLSLYKAYKMLLILDRLIITHPKITLIRKYPKLIPYFYIFSIFCGVSFLHWCFDVCRPT